MSLTSSTFSYNLITVSDSSISSAFLSLLPHSVECLPPGHMKEDSVMTVIGIKLPKQKAYRGPRDG